MITDENFPTTASAVWSDSLRTPPSGSWAERNSGAPSCCLRGRAVAAARGANACEGETKRATHSSKSVIAKRDLEGPGAQRVATIVSGAMMRLSQGIAPTYPSSLTCPSSGLSQLPSPLCRRLCLPRVVSFPSFGGFTPRPRISEVRRICQHENNTAALPPFRCQHTFPIVLLGKNHSLQIPTSCCSSPSPYRPPSWPPPPRRMTA